MSFLVRTHRPLDAVRPSPRRRDCDGIARDRPCGRGLLVSMFPKAMWLAVAPQIAVAFGLVLAAWLAYAHGSPAWFVHLAAVAGALIVVPGAVRWEREARRRLKLGSLIPVAQRSLVSRERSCASAGGCRCGVAGLSGSSTRRAGRPNRRPRSATIATGPAPACRRRRPRRPCAATTRRSGCRRSSSRCRASRPTPTRAGPRRAPDSRSVSPLGAPSSPRPTGSRCRCRPAPRAGRRRTGSARRPSEVGEADRGRREEDQCCAAERSDPDEEEASERRCRRPTTASRMPKPALVVSRLSFA